MIYSEEDSLSLLSQQVGRLATQRIQRHTAVSSSKPEMLQEKEAHQSFGYFTSEEKHMEQSQQMSEDM